MINSGWPRMRVPHYGQTELTRQQEAKTVSGKGKAKAILHDNKWCDEGAAEDQAPSMAAQSAARWPFPIWDHRTASSTMESAIATTDRLTPSNTLWFRSFHRHHDPRIVRESKPLRRAVPSRIQRDSHQSRKLVPGCGVRGETLCLYCRRTRDPPQVHNIQCWMWPRGLSSNFLLYSLRFQA